MRLELTTSDKKMLDRKILNHVLVIFTALLIQLCITACYHPTVQNDNKPLQTQPQTQFDKTAIFAILATDNTLSKEFNRWNHLPKTKNNVYFFAKNNLAMDRLEGTKYLVERTQLAQQMSKVLASISVDRLIIFINAHGAINGNWCYEGKNQCLLTEDTLIEALQSYSQTKEPKIRHVLVATDSCYNKPIMDRFGKKTKKLNWPFEVSYIEQIANESCATQSPAESLMENLLTPLEDVTGDKQIESFLAISNLQQFIAFSNDTIPAGLRNDLSYEVHSSSLIKLADFGFDIGLSVPLFNVSDADAVLFPYNNKKVNEALSALSLANKLCKYVDQVIISPENGSEIEVNIKGDCLTVINIPSLNNKKYCNFSVVLRNINHS